MNIETYRNTIIFKNATGMNKTEFKEFIISLKTGNKYNKWVREWINSTGGGGGKYSSLFSSRNITYIDDSSSSSSSSDSSSSDSE